VVASTAATRRSFARQGQVLNLKSSNRDSGPFGQLEISPIQNMIHFPIKIRKNEQEVTKINFSFNRLILPIQ
jgi:hypothetical protein